jgi:CO/xanthine dehydrogenase Mo-binding subunit
MAGVELYKCPNVEASVSPVYTNRTVSGNFRGPEYPQGFFGIQSMMDDVAYRLKMDPVEFGLKNIPTLYRDETPFTNYTLDECIRRGAEAFGWKQRWRPTPGSDPGPIKRGAGFTYMMFRSAPGMSSAVLQVDSAGRYTVFVGVTDVGAGAKTTMGLIAAEALGVPLSRVEVVWGDTDRCPYSVGESGSRTTIMTGYAVVQAAADLKKQIADKGLPPAGRTLVATASPSPRLDGKTRNAFGAHFVEAEVDTQTGRVRVTKYVTVHDCGRIMNPLSADGQIKGAAVMGLGQALHENLVYDARSGQPLSAGYYFDRVPTHRDAPDVEVTFIENDDGYGPFGAKAIGESGIILSPGAINNAIFNAIGRRLKDLPITRDRILGALA